MKAIRILLCMFLSVGAFSLIVLHAEEEPAVDPGKYEYVSREDLDMYVRMEERVDQDRTGEERTQHNKFLGKRVTFCDELSVFWDEIEDTGTQSQVDERNSKGYIDDYDNQEFLRNARLAEKYYKFDTYLFRCVVPKSLRESVAYVRYVNQIKNEKRLLMIWGRVEKIPLFLPVDNEYGAQEAGTKSEEIFIVCESIKRPRERYFEEWAKEDK
jgi:hypothetical protein